MNPIFWHERWQDRNIGFHQAEGNPLLKAHIDVLSLPAGARILLPLCGKTGDIAWLLAQGFRVVGVELSEIAITELFDELGITPSVQKLGEYKHYHADGLDIWVGNFFAVTLDMLGEVDAVYDRAALVALPEGMRSDYAKHVMALSRTAPQLLICFTYNQDDMDGPPFSIADAELKAHYAASYALQLLACTDMLFRNGLPMQEKAWLLS